MPIVSRRTTEIASEYRFMILLVALACFLVVMPLVGVLVPHSRPLLARAIVMGSFVAIVMPAVYAVVHTRSVAVFALSLALPTVLLDGLRMIPGLSSSPALAAATHGFEIAFLAYVSVLILRYVFVAKHVTTNTICAALCVYLLMGLLWAIVYSTLEVVSPGSWLAGGADVEAAGIVRQQTAGGGEGVMQFGGQGSVQAVYFSFVTLTTLGYGDVLPATDFAKMLSVGEAVIGQLFLAVLVARLVGLQIANSVGRRNFSDPE